MTINHLKCKSMKMTKTCLSNKMRTLEMIQVQSLENWRMRIINLITIIQVMGKKSISQIQLLKEKEVIIIDIIVKTH